MGRKVGLEMKQKRDIIFEPGSINKMMLKNRVIMTAMHLGYEFEKEKAFYIERAKGGTAAITTVVGVRPEGTYRNMLCAGEETGKKLKNLASALHSYDCKLIVQLFCAGRNGAKGMMAEPDLEPMAPSCVKSGIYKYLPKEMTLRDIDDTIDAFGKAAVLCREKGVDAVEVSCSAGYLLSQFLSPITNLRRDAYGGSEEKRMAFPIQVLEKIRSQVGMNYPVILRISGSDMIGGYDITYMQEFIRAIPCGLIDAVNVTGGWHESSVPQIDAHLPKGGWAILASQIKKVTDLPVIACNRINDRETIEGVLTKGLADFVGCARAHLADARFVERIKEGRPYIKCIGCNKGCIEPILKMKEVQCVMNPVVCGLDNVKRAEKRQNVLVIGSGPAGLMSAKIMAVKGHKVTVCTEEEKAGGLVNLACLPPGKNDIHGLIDTLIQDLEELHATIEYNQFVDQKYLEEHDFDFVVVATGSSPVKLPLGEDAVYTADQVLTADSQTLSKILKGKTAIIGGGLVGIETALFLIAQSYISEEILRVIETYNSGERYGNLYSYPDIAILEMEEKIGRELGSTRFLVKKELKDKSVKTLTSAKAIRYENGKLYYESDGERRLLDADTVIMALGYKSRGKELVTLLREKKIPYAVVGDARKPANVKEALMGAYETLK